MVSPSRFTPVKHALLRGNWQHMGFPAFSLPFSRAFFVLFKDVGLSFQAFKIEVVSFQNLWS